MSANTLPSYPFDIRKAKETALNAALEAGNLIKTVLLNHLEQNIKTKSTSTDFVTETDEKCDKTIIELLKKDFPDFEIISEETFNSVMELSDKPTWIIDPIDGTTNFVHRNPFVAVSIGLTYLRQCVLGVIVLPMLDETYTAIKGEGAFKTDLYRSEPFRISVSSNNTISTSLLGSNFPYDRSDAALQPVFARYNALLKRGVRGIRGTGSACVNLVHVACGSLDGYFENGLHSWDMAAGKVIIEEAGGVVLDINAGPIDIMERRILACSNLELAKEVSEVLVDSDKQFA
jgi:fructose-1,6-bisphosphatase/inositol monophosphatase family enzyme